MRLETLWIALLCVAFLAGSFAAGLALMGSPSTANREEASPRSRLSSDHHGSKGTGEAKAEQVPQEAADLDPQQAPMAPVSFSTPEPRKRQLTLAEVSEIDKSIGRRVTWVGQPITSQSERGGTQHIFFGQGPGGEFSFDFVFIAEEPEPYKQSPGSRVLDDLRQRFLEERRQQRKEKERRRTEERERQREEYRKAGKEGIRQRIEATRRRLEEARQPDKHEERKAKVKGQGPKPAPIFVTVTGTITRFDALILLGYGNRYAVPVLRDVTITADP